MNVLLGHCYYRQRGGEDLSFEQEGDLLESQGHHVTRFVVHNDCLEGMGRIRAAGKALWNRQACRQLKDVLGRQKPDVAHFTNTFPLLSPAVLATASRAGVAVVQSLRNYRLICANAQLMRDGKICEKCVGHTPIAALQHACYRNSRAATAVVLATSFVHRLLRTYQHVDVFYAPTQFARSKLIAAGLPADRVLVKPNF